MIPDNKAFFEALYEDSTGQKDWLLVCFDMVWLGIVLYIVRYIVAECDHFENLHFTKVHKPGY